MGSSLVLNRRPKVPAEDTAAFGAIAERFRRAGALEQAVSLCRDGLKKFPDHVSARVTLGWSLLDLGKYDEARVELEQVMRRAPDNLAAIRGLAELHDRFEHTLNLPMDGPGQWPPPADSVDGEAIADHAPTLEVADADVSPQFEVEAAAQPEPVFSEAAMAPADMGLPLWTPEPASSPVAEPATASVTPSGSGMSSVREIDAFAGEPVMAKEPAAPESRAQEIQVVQQTYETVEDVQFEIDAPVVAMAAHAGVTETEQEEIDLALDIKPDSTLELARDLTLDVAPDLNDELSVTDDALAALIAEADSLDAAAAMEVVAEPDSLELGSVEVELDTTAALEAVELEPAVPTELELATAELMVEATAEPMVEATAEPVAEAVAEPVIESLAHPIAEPVAESIVEPIAESIVEPVLETALEPAIELESALESQVVAQVAEVIAFAARPTAVAESVELEPMELLQDEQEVPVSVIAMPSKSAATVVALERMLRRVHTRRRQLMAESVA